MPSVRSPLVPSAKREFTSTLPLGMVRYGLPYVRLPFRLSVVSLSTTFFTYDVCRACAPAFQLVRSPPCAGNSVTRLPAGVWRFQLPLSVRFMVVPEVELGGVRSIVPKREP